jgi:hypothetical protein
MALQQPKPIVQGSTYKACTSMQVLLLAACTSGWATTNAHTRKLEMGELAVQKDRMPLEAAAMYVHNPSQVFNHPMCLQPPCHNLWAARSCNDPIRPDQHTISTTNSL